MKINEYSRRVSDSSIVPYSPIHQEQEKTSIFRKIINLIRDHFKKDPAKEDSKTILEFFEYIHIEGGKEKEVIKRLRPIFEKLQGAKEMGQVALVDKLSEGLLINVYESILAANGYNRYVSFDQLEKCAIPGKRVVDIDYISNFGRIIPTEIIKAKKKCDSLRVFDNYCVMYYDPTGATYEVPQKVKRDPILFGLINHSEKLYYIADWEDPNCDLTLKSLGTRLTIGSL